MSEKKGNPVGDLLHEYANSFAVHPASGTALVSTADGRIELSFYQDRIKFLTEKLEMSSPGEAKPTGDVAVQIVRTHMASVIMGPQQLLNLKNAIDQHLGKHAEPESSSQH